MSATASKNDATVVQSGPTAPASALTPAIPAVVEVVPRPGDVLEYDMREGRTLRVFYRPLTDAETAQLPQAMIMSVREVDAAGKVFNQSTALDAAQIRRRVLAAFRPKKAAR